MNTTIDRLVNRFLRWKLPKDFYPDGGIFFKRIPDFPERNKWEYEPIGTNLFTADQAKAMFEYLLADEPQAILLQGNAESHKVLVKRLLSQLGCEKDDPFAYVLDINDIVKICNAFYSELSQGEPVAWQVSHSVLRNYWKNCTKAEYDLRSQIDIDNGWKWRELFTSLPSTEALLKDKAELIEYANELKDIFKNQTYSEFLLPTQPKCMQVE